MPVFVVGPQQGSIWPLRPLLMEPDGWLVGFRLVGLDFWQIPQ